MSNITLQHTFTVQENEHNQRVDQFLSTHIQTYSRSKIQTWIENGHVRIEGKPCKPKKKLTQGETITLKVPIEPEISNQPQKITFEVVYEDEDILVINKPIGLVVHPGAGNHDQTLLNGILYHCPNNEYLPRAGIVHRLDKDTSGLMVVAKNNPSILTLCELIKTRTMKREYQAIVQGTLIEPQTIHAPIDRHRIHRTKMTVCSHGKPATTHIKILNIFEHHTHIHCQLETGRTHQIRVHLCHIKHPIVGDPLYGKHLNIANSKHISPELKTTCDQYGHQALHAFQLSFPHPMTQKPLSFHAALPKDFQALIALLTTEAS